MSSSGYLVPPSKDPSQENLWVETWKRIDRFLPDLRNELALEEPEVSQEAQQPQTEAKTETEAEPKPESASEPVEQPADEKGTNGEEVAVEH